MHVDDIHPVPPVPPGLRQRLAQWVWICPGCGSETLAYVDERATREEMRRDT